MRPAAVSPYGPRGPFGGERHCCHYRRVIPRSQGRRCYLSDYFCTGRWSSVADGDHFERVARFDRAAARTGVRGPNASLGRPVSSRWAAASGPCCSSVRASRTAMTRPREATRPTTEHVGHRQPNRRSGTAAGSQTSTSTCRCRSQPAGQPRRGRTPTCIRTARAGRAHSGRSVSHAHTSTIRECGTAREPRRIGPVGRLFRPPGQRDSPDVVVFKPAVRSESPAVLEPRGVLAVVGTPGRGAAPSETVTGRPPRHPRERAGRPVSGTCWPPRLGKLRAVGVRR